MVKWESINDNDDHMLLSDRLKVHNGWIIRSRYTMDVNGYSVGSIHQIFVLDMQHEHDPKNEWK